MKWWKERRARNAQIRDRIHAAIQAEATAVPDLDERTLDRQLSAIMRPGEDVERRSVPREETERESVAMPREQVGGHPRTNVLRLHTRTERLAHIALLVRVSAEILKVVIRMISGH